ncbi:MAG: nucleotide exchange factor GrpE [Pseudomonadota bacterium]
MPNSEIETLDDELPNDAETEVQASETEVVAEMSVEEELLACRAEIEKLKDAALRAMAEGENIRRRSERDRTDARLYAIDKFARDLLPIADVLARALGAVTPEQRADEGFNSFVDGMELTEKELYSAFERHHLVRIGIQGEKFDPNLHQAVAQIPSAIPKDHIAEVFQPGFTLSGRVLRAAMVAVSAGD